LLRQYDKRTASNSSNRLARVASPIRQKNSKQFFESLGSRCFANTTKPKQAMENLHSPLLV